MDENLGIVPRSFYVAPATVVAPALLGAVLHHKVGDTVLSGMITEVEAYRGHLDDASHAFKGKTPRTEVMFGPAGHAYVYLIYGMWHCMNVVCEQEGIAEAVLIRALEPLAGIEQIRRNRGGRAALTDGPGKLCQALEITREMNGASLLAPPLWITHGPGQLEYSTSPRIGIDYATHNKDELWRYVADKDAVTRSIRKNPLRKDFPEG